jgi:hypothetical protein
MSRRVVARAGQGHDGGVEGEQDEGERRRDERVRILPAEGRCGGAGRELADVVEDVADEQALDVGTVLRLASWALLRTQPARVRSKGTVVSSANCSPLMPVTKCPPRIRPRASRRRSAQRISRHGTASRSLR